MQQIKLNIPIEQCKPIPYPNCLGTTFDTTRIQLREVPRIYQGNGVPEFIPMPIIVCTGCRKEYLSPEELKSKIVT